MALLNHRALQANSEENGDGGGGLDVLFWNQISTELSSALPAACPMLRGFISHGLGIKKSHHEAGQLGAAISPFRKHESRPPTTWPSRQSLATTQSWGRRRQEAGSQGQTQPRVLGQDTTSALVHVALFRGGIRAGPTQQCFGAAAGLLLGEGVVLGTVGDYTRTDHIHGRCFSPCPISSPGT